MARDADKADAIARALEDGGIIITVDRAALLDVLRKIGHPAADDFEADTEDGEDA